MPQTRIVAERDRAASVLTANVPPAGDDILDVDGVARFVRCSPAHVRAMVAANKFPAPAKLGRLSRWSRAVVEQWIRDQSGVRQTRDHRHKRLTSYGATAGARTAATPTAAGRTISGYAAVWHDPADRGTEYELADGMFERIMPGAFDQTLNDDDQLALLGHDDTRILARRSAGTLRLTQDAKGLRYEIDAAKTATGDEALELVRTRALQGASFQFSSLGEDGSRYYLDGQRTIVERRAIKLYEVSLVGLPAYTSTTATLGGPGGRSARTADLDAINAAIARCDFEDRAPVLVPRYTSPVAAGFARLAARCRLLSARADQSRVAAVLAGETAPRCGRSAPAVLCDFCGLDALADFGGGCVCMGD